MEHNQGTPSPKELAKSFIVLIVLITLIILAIWLLVFLVSSTLNGLLSTLSTLDAAIVVALITGCVSIVTVVLGAIINNILTIRQSRNEYLRSHREAPYQKLIEIVYKIMEKSRRHQTYSNDEVFEDMTEFNKSLTLWGSAKAIRLWDKWRLASVGQTPTPEQLLLAMERVIIQLRLDMGQSCGIKQGDILKLFINDVDDAILKKNQGTKENP